MVGKGNVKGRKCGSFSLDIIYIISRNNWNFKEYINRDSDMQIKSLFVYMKLVLLPEVLSEKTSTLTIHPSTTDFIQNSSPSLPTISHQLSGPVDSTFLTFLDSIYSLHLLYCSFRFVCFTFGSDHCNTLLTFYLVSLTLACYLSSFLKHSSQMMFLLFIFSITHKKKIQTLLNLGLQFCLYQHRHYIPPKHFQLPQHLDIWGFIFILFPP